MKKIFPLFMFCCITFVGWAADAPKYFAVWLNNGQRIDILLSEKPTVKFTEGFLRFEAPSTAIEYSASEVKEFTLESMPSSGIKSLSSNGKNWAFSQSGDVLSISGAEPYAKIQLYSAGGVLISTHAVDGNGTLNIPLNRLDHRVYILKTTSTTFKIMKR